MAVQEWSPGELIQPGDLRRPVGSGDVSQMALENADFEAGNSGWTWGGSDAGHGINTDSPVFDGTYSAKVDQSSNATLKNDARLPCEPGQLVTLRAYARHALGGSLDGDEFVKLNIQWYNSGSAEIQAVGSTYFVVNMTSGWVPMEIAAIAPAGAAYWTAYCLFDYNDGVIAVDSFTYEYATQAAATHNLFKATQAAAGFTDNVEPDWPTVVGNTVVDNEVTWEAVSGNTITWQANRILVSATAEPTWPTQVNGSVVDGSIIWVLDPRQVTDAKCPNTIPTAIGSSKIFRADEDIIRFSATVNPLDYTTSDDAGFLPFAHQDYGSNNVAAMALYRGNLAAFNSEGCQIWQINEDPEAMSFLDAVPVPCTYPKSLAPVGDDLVGLTNVGIRSLRYAGASVNLQAGYLGKPIDTLVVARIADAVTNGWTPRALYWAAAGQYWLFFGAEAFVLTVHGEGAQAKLSWSRYTFPSAIDYWTIKGVDLYLRSGRKVWKIDDDALLDDQLETASNPTGTEFTGVIQWPHADLGKPGRDKTLKAFDLVIKGTCDIIIGWDQSETQDYSVSNAWTTPYSVSGDTLPNKPIPFEITGPSFALRLEFDGNQAWEWYQANLYMDDSEA